MSQNTSSISLSSRLDLYERQLHQVRDAVSSLEALESHLEPKTQAQLPIDPSAWLDFQRNVASCRSTLAQMEDLSRNPDLQEISQVVRARLEQLTAKIQQCAPIDPKPLLLEIAARFGSHDTQGAWQDFRQFEQQFPKLAGVVYGNLWKIKGSPDNLSPDFGHHAFHHVDGFHSLDIEKAEAITLICTSVEERLAQCIELFRDSDDLEAFCAFGEIQAVYPKVADTVFGMVWEVYGKPTAQSQPEIAHDQFGTLVLHNKHKKVVPDLAKKIEALQLALPHVRQQLATPEFYVAQNKVRRDLRCLEVIHEQLEILQQGFYTAPSGTQHAILDQIQRSIAQTTLCHDGGPATPKARRYQETLFEVRPHNCVTIAHALVSEGDNKVNVMNFANSDVPGGAYLRHAGSQEEELFRCTGLPLALDQTHGAQEKAFYPIHKTAGPSGGLYTPGTPLIRMGIDSDFRLLENPVMISVGTFAAFNQPKLDLTNPKDPLLQGHELQITREKIRTYLKSAYDHGDDTLVMGAFGCGAFANPPGHISRIMMDLLQTEYAGVFKKVVFAVMKDSAEGFKHNPTGNFLPFATAVRQHGGAVYGVNGEVI